MTAQLIDGKELAKKIKTELKSQINAGSCPCLAVVLVGEDPASKVYVKAKTKAANWCGIKVRDVSLPADISQENLESELAALNANEDVSAILLQLPLPSHLDEFAALVTIDPGKDADGLHPFNQGLLQWGSEGPRPCTPAGCIELAKHSLGDDLSGMHAVVVGRSVLVGKPLASLLCLENCTSVLCHSRTKDLKRQMLSADILFLAIGKAEHFDASYVREGACVIDVGINRGEDGSLVGDASFASVVNVAGSITPVPGGVGPMTIAMLLKNTFELWKRHH